MRCAPRFTTAAPCGGLFLYRRDNGVGVESVAPQVRVSLDGKWLAWRAASAESSAWTVLALDGGGSTAQVTGRAVDHWHALVAAAPLLSKWYDEIRCCIGDQPVEACSECTGLAMAATAVELAAQL